MAVEPGAVGGESGSQKAQRGQDDDAGRHARAAHPCRRPPRLRTQAVRIARADEGVNSVRNDTGLEADGKSALDSIRQSSTLAAVCNP